MCSAGQDRPPRKLLTRPKKLCAAEIGEAGPLIEKKQMLGQAEGLIVSQWSGSTKTTGERGDKGSPSGTLWGGRAASLSSRHWCCFFSCCDN